MKCPNCGNRVKKGETVCRFCRAELAVKQKNKKPKKEKTNKLGNCAIVFAFLMPFIGLILGILAVCKSSSDVILRRDGIKAIVMSVVVTTVIVLFTLVLLMVGVTIPFIFPQLGV